MPSPMEISRRNRSGHWRPALALFLGLAGHGFAEEPWGERVTLWHATENAHRYDVYRSNIAYAASPFRITDLRPDDTNAPPFYVYSDKTDFETRTLTIYRAHDGARFFRDQPVVFFVHGGAWVDGYADWYDFVAQSFTGEKGWVTVVVDYRLTSSNVFLAADCPDRTNCPPEDRVKAAWYDDNLGDVETAFHWTADHIGAHGGRTNWIVVMGHSAGAHLSTLLLTHTNTAPAATPRAALLVSMSGVYAITNLGPLLLGFQSEMEQTFHGGIANVPVLNDASPARQVSAETGLPPAFILYSQPLRDLPGFYLQGEAFHALLQSLGHDSTNLVLPDIYDHAGEMEAIGRTNETPTAAIVDFVETRLRLRDTNANGVPDWWEWEHFTNLTSVTANSNHDGDGFSDLQEFVADTDPASEESHFRVASISAANECRVACLGSPARVYTLECTPHLGTGGWSAVAGQVQVDGTDALFLTDTNRLDGVPAYRVRVQLP